MAKMERAHSNQQAVLKRKAEEASAANNRLKEVCGVDWVIIKLI